jgi:hypothetical protein
MLAIPFRPRKERDGIQTLRRKVKMTEAALKIMVLA